jgi:hypothetical protein
MIPAIFRSQFFLLPTDLRVAITQCPRVDPTIVVIDNAP